MRGVVRYLIEMLFKEQVIMLVEVILGIFDDLIRSFFAQFHNKFVLLQILFFDLNVIEKGIQFLLFHQQKLQLFIVIAAKIHIFIIEARIFLILLHTILLERALLLSSIHFNTLYL